MEANQQNVALIAEKFALEKGLVSNLVKSEITRNIFL
jgi:hypothetical protein